MEFKKAMEIMRLICRCVDVDCDECPLFIDGKCSVRSWDDSDAVRVEGILEEWEKEHPEPQYPTWGDWLNSVTRQMADGDLLSSPIPADIAEKLGLEPKEG